MKNFTSTLPDEDPIELYDTPDFVRILQNTQSDDIKLGPPDEEEIRNVVKKQKVRKSTIDIPMTYIKYSMGIKEFIEEIHVL